MDTTEASSPAQAGATLSPQGSQSKLSPALLFLLLAALLFRVVTAVMDRNANAAVTIGLEAPPLVRWIPLEKAVTASSAQGKPVLYDFTAEWCAPCHRLDDEGWGDRKIAALASETFLPTRVMDRSREEGKNSPLVDELQRKYGVEAFPTLIVTGADGRQIARMEGWDGRDALRKFLEESRTKSGSAAR
jgi:thiol-disulfide isomerase/thioredoxin